MNIEETRIAKLREYLIGVLDSLLTNDDFQINANMLDNNINNYSLDKIPTASTVERWITGLEINRDVYSFRSRNAYSQDTINNLANIGFFEKFESLISSNNKNKILPEIEGIDNIACLNCGTMVSNETNTAEFDIQVEIRYMIGGEI